jgi:serine/threonine-protein kinase
MIGQTVGKYRVEERIGRGGMGTVYRAVDETLRREVAIKVLNSELNDPEVAKRFRTEAITVARLNHAGIATVYELFEHDGQWLMVMEFVRGETLERLIERAGPLSAERAAELCMQALAALTHAHGLGVVHRDLKPANLMLTDGGAVKIMDFGIARVSGSEHLTNVGFMMGTPAYMAPEQVLGHEVDARTDIYAMGVVMYRLTTAKLPFKGETPFALAQSQVNDPPTPVRMAREGLPAWLELVLGRALAKAPVERFQTAFEFRDALQRSLAGLPIPSLFDQTAPTGMMRTPVGLPSGAFGTSPPVSGAIPTGGGTGAQASMTGSATAPTMSVSTAQTMMASSTGAAPVSVSPAGSTGAVAQVPATVTVATAVPAAPKPVKKNSNVMMIGIAAGVLVLATVVYLMMRSPAPATPAAPAVTTSAPDTPPSAPPPDASASSAAGTAAATGTPGQPASSTPPVTTPAPASGSGAGASGASATGAAGAAPATGAASTAPAVTPATTPATAPAGAAARGDAGRAAGRPGGPGTVADVADTLIVFSDAKLVTFDGRKGRDQDVILHFGSGEISVIPKKGGAALIAIPYKKVAHATYSHTKDPKWDPSLTGLPENPDIPGFMRGSRNWLVLQWKTDSVVLYLTDSNATEVLRTFEVRTGLKIDRPSDGGK